MTSCGMRRCLMPILPTPAQHVVHVGVIVGDLQAKLCEAPPRLQAVHHRTCDEDVVDEER